MILEKKIETIIRETVLVVLDSTTESLTSLTISQPVRDHFKTDARAKNLLKQIKVTINIYMFPVLLIIHKRTLSHSFGFVLCRLTESPDKITEPECVIVSTKLSLTL